MHILDIARQFVESSALIVDDPTFEWFLFYIDFGASTGLFADKSHDDSAIAYLKRTGENELADKLDIARMIMMDIQSRSAYRLQKIDGLETLAENYMKVGMSTDLTMTWLETTKWDLRFVAYWLQRCYYDDMRQLEILPNNLKRFPAMLYFYDMYVDDPDINNADFNESSDNLRQPRYSAYSNDTVRNVKTPLGMNERQHIVIHMPNCRLSSNPIPTVADNTNQEPGMQMLKLTTGWTFTSCLFPYADNFDMYGKKPFKSVKTTFNVSGVDIPMHMQKPQADSQYFQNTPVSKQQSLQSSIKDYATATVLGQMSALRQAGQAYVGNAMSGALAQTTIDNKIREAYTLLMKPGFTQAELMSELDKMFANSNSAYVKNLASNPNASIAGSAYKKTLV
jgi:hypothetical protein